MVKHAQRIELNCFCGMVDRRNAFSLISSRDHRQRSSPSRIFDMPPAGFEPVQNLSSGLIEWSAVANCWRIVWLWLTILCCWRLKGSEVFLKFAPGKMSGAYPYPNPITFLSGFFQHIWKSCNWKKALFLSFFLFSLDYIIV